MALVELEQEFILPDISEWTHPTFKDCAAFDVQNVFFNLDEFGEIHLVDGKEAPVIYEDLDVRRYSSHWEAGAKQNFDEGLYTAMSILYIRMADYGPRPKVDKTLVLDGGTNRQRTFFIKKCEEEAGIYRFTLERQRM